MGSSGSREEIENQMSLIKLKRMEIQVEKEKELKKLSEMDGKPISRVNIPDYIDPEFAKQKNLYIEYVNQKEKKVRTDISTQELSKKNIKKKKENSAELNKKKEEIKNNKIKDKTSTDDFKKEKDPKEMKKDKKDKKSKNNTKSRKKIKKLSKSDK